LAQDNGFRFSTKRADDLVGFILYEYRPYSPTLGRWPNRDPLGEMGGLSLYGALNNNPTGDFDLDGRDNWNDPNSGQNSVSNVQMPLPPGSPFNGAGAGWRMVWVFEQCGVYRELYSAEAAELRGKSGQVPRSELERLRGELKAKYQVKTPPEVEAALRAYCGEGYDKRTATGGFNPGKTNEAINRAAKCCKVAGRVFLVVMVYDEYAKVRDADDWNRQLGSSGSGFLGAVGGGALGAEAGFAVGGSVAGPKGAVAGAIIGGVAGGITGYEVASGTYEVLYDTYCK
jgi:RHS repeat-associated protein